ncbi:type II toxin-antitoxin system RelE/ParE family toxin [Candidatus Bathyarchaeota archaeon]|nr:MAG: type II toxin-antitoxin system RelE/ParE family toxin [Candidatus Bathyarchaeota archaeon]
MARYKILIAKRAYKTLSELDEKVRSRILIQLSDLQNFPFLTMPHDLAKLKGKENYYRLRVGDIRILFKIDKQTKTVCVEKIGHRKRIYQ